MKHAREDYARIQDPAGLIPEDEPVFLIRAQDENSWATVLGWARRAELKGARPDIVDLARKQAALMLAWPRHKRPDLPAVAADPEDLV